MGREFERTGSRLQLPQEERRGRAKAGVDEDCHVVLRDRLGILHVELVVGLHGDPGEIQLGEAGRQRRPEAVVAPPGIPVADDEDALLICHRKLLRIRLSPSL